MARKKTKRSAGAAGETPAAKAERTPKSSGKPAASRRRKAPNWPLLGLAMAGALLTAYLTLTTWMSAAPAFCGEGSSCDVVQASRWGTLLGMPVSFWGLLAYLTLGHVAYRIRHAEWHWKLHFVIGGLGAAISIYLTAISVVVLQATCFYCLISLALFLAIFALALFQKPEGIPEFTWPSWLAQTGVLAVAMVAVLHLHYSGVFDAGAGPEDPYLRGLAEHLEDSGARFYGASWCPHCQEQKDLFGASADRLPYVECSPQGRGGPSAPACVQNEIRSFPTWIVGGDRRTGVLPPRELARLSNYTATREASAATN